MLADSSQERGCEALRREFLHEFHRTRDVAHRLCDDLTAISGYAEIMMMRGGPEQAVSELRKILERAKKSMTLLRDCISNLQELGRRHS